MQFTLLCDTWHLIYQFTTLRLRLLFIDSKTKVEVFAFSTLILTKKAHSNIKQSLNFSVYNYTPVLTELKKQENYPIYAIYKQIPKLFMQQLQKQNAY